MPTGPNPNNPRADADAVLPDGYVARVLEPSPPAVLDGEWFADDPVNVVVDGRALDGGTVVSPIPGGDQTWVQMVESHPELADFARDRWLGAYPPVTAAPAGYADSLVALHRLAMAAIAPARHQVNGKFGLRWVRGGFGTPFFGDDNAQVRVIGGEILVERAGSVVAYPITSINQAAADIGCEVDLETATEHDSPEIGSCDEPLTVDAAHAGFISRWWGLGTAALEIVRADAVTVNPGRVQLWPGHFDVGVEFGGDNDRASYGASPGDHSHSEPYLYVAPWWTDRLDLGDDPFWNSSAFTGAELSITDLAAAQDQGRDPVAVAVAFYIEARDLLAAAAMQTVAE